MIASLKQSIGRSTDETDKAQIARLRKALKRIADLPPDSIANRPIKRTHQQIAMAALRYHLQKSRS
jgi:hypothetical protein